MDESQWLAERFEADRTHLRSVAYRMLGSLSEAEDAVQEAWLRLSRSGTGEVENLGGWMTTVVARVCLDMLRSRRSRREEAFADYAPEPVATGQAAVDPEPPSGARATFAAMAYLDEAVTGFGGIALRYGGFYGAPDDGWGELVRRRKFPIVGEGSGVFSWIHLDDAAAATVLALGHEGPAIYNIVDDEPAPVRDWLPAMAKALGAKPPRRFPAWLARPVAGEAAVVMATETRGASNAKAKRELGWSLRYPSWRQGFPAVYAELAGPGRRIPQRAASRPPRTAA